MQGAITGGAGENGGWIALGAICEYPLTFSIAVHYVHECSHSFPGVFSAISTRQKCATAEEECRFT
jgi:hypothetical protein